MCPFSLQMTQKATPFYPSQDLTFPKIRGFQLVKIFMYLYQLLIWGRIQWSFITAEYCCGVDCWSSLVSTPPVAFWYWNPWASAGNMLSSWNFITPAPYTHGDVFTKKKCCVPLCISPLTGWPGSMGQHTGVAEQQHRWDHGLWSSALSRTIWTILLHWWTKDRNKLLVFRFHSAKFPD